MISDFRSGLTFWWRGWRFLLSHRGLLAVASTPIVISILTFAGFIWLLWTHLGSWVDQLISLSGLSSGGLWYDLAYYPIIVGGGLIVSIALLYLLFIAHSFIAVPFYSLLADRTLNRMGKRPEGQSWMSALRLFRAGALKSILLILVGLVLFVFSFVPILNLLAMTAAMFLLAFDCMDYAFDGMGFGMKQRLSYLARERAQWAGMATALALTLLIPGLTLLITPGAVVGGALILKERK